MRNSQAAPLFNGLARASDIVIHIGAEAGRNEVLAPMAAAGAAVHPGRVSV